jgi:hypothetical protein
VETDIKRNETNRSFLGALRRILLAYAVRNRDVGYCQSMNFLVGVLFIHADEVPLAQKETMRL